MTVGDNASSAVRRYDWNGDELFVLASAHGGVLRRVFLGDMTYKLLRATPVPAVVLPATPGGEMPNRTYSLTEIVGTSPTGSTRRSTTGWSARRRRYATSTGSR